MEQRSRKDTENLEGSDILRWLKPALHDNERVPFRKRKLGREEGR